MTHTTEVKPKRYSLRPNPTIYDLRINKNRFGLQRRTINRVSKSQSSYSNRSNHSIHPIQVPDVNKRKLIIVRIKNEISRENNEQKHDQKETIQAKVISMAEPKSTWNIPKRTLEDCTRKPPSIAYDVSTVAQFMNLNEECIFEILNHLSLNDLCAMAEVCSQLKLAAQKYFEVIYTAVKMSWLVDDGSSTFTLLQAKRLLYNFGHLISTLIVNTEQLDPNDSKEKLLELVEKYSSGVLFWNAKY